MRLQSALPLFMKKHIIDLRVVGVEHPTDHHVLLRLSDKSQLPQMLPGQFVEVRVDNSPATFLRRPISIHNVDEANNELWLLVAAVGNGTKQLLSLKVGDTLNCVLPLGNGFTMPDDEGSDILLIGGGVGVAPLLYYGRKLKEHNHNVTFLLGARSEGDILQRREFERYGTVCLTTEDGSAGEQGFVTNHSILNKKFSNIACCGPMPMMKAVAQFAHKTNTPCEVSLENMMACGVGACLCCVEKTTRGNVCVCTEGPVFNIKDLEL